MFRPLIIARLTFFFHEIAEVYILLREWCECTDALRKEMAERMIAKYKKYWGDHESFNTGICGCCS